MSMEQRRPLAAFVLVTVLTATMLGGSLRNNDLADMFAAVIGGAMQKAVIAMPLGPVVDDQGRVFGGHVLTPLPSSGEQTDVAAGSAPVEQRAAARTSTTAVASTAPGPSAGTRVGDSRRAARDGVRGRLSGSGAAARVVGRAGAGSTGGPGPDRRAGRSGAPGNGTPHHVPGRNKARGQAPDQAPDQATAPATSGSKGGTEANGNGKAHGAGTATVGSSRGAAGQPRPAATAPAKGTGSRSKASGSSKVSGSGKASSSRAGHGGNKARGSSQSRGKGRSRR